MEHLSQGQLAELLQRLRDERTQLRQRQSSEDAEVSAEAERGDTQDKASEEARRRTALRRRQHHEARLREVEAALQRMDEGVYGLCEETDEPIPFARLRAEPTTRYTVEALELLEQERAREQAQGHSPDDADVY